MRIGIVGTGYIGLVTGTCFAEMGHDVLCIDVDEAKIAALKQGRCPIYEPGLEELIKRNLEEERLAFTTSLDETVQRSLVIFITVGTPEDRDGSADLAVVYQVAQGIGKAMEGYRIIVDKSTVPVGTAEKVRQAIAGQTEHPFDVVSNPEFLKEGAAIEDFMRPDRIVIGADDARALGIMKELYSPFVRTGRPILEMDVKSAEMTKYAANAMLAARISFMNEIANLCELLGADAEVVRQGIGSDSRIGFSYLFPGIGYGGSCFPKDVRALVKSAEEVGYDFKILKAVDAVNDHQKRLLTGKIQAQFGSDLRDHKIAIWGLSFKPKTDDIREAPSRTIIDRLLEMGAKLHVYDPEGMDAIRKVYGDSLEYAVKNYHALEGADALVLVTEWPEFRRPDFERMGKLMRQKVVFDGRNIYDPKTMKKYGFTYYGIGRSA